MAGYRQSPNHLARHKSPLASSAFSGPACHAFRDTMHTVLVDDEPCVRSALKLLLEDHLGFSVVGELTEAASLPSLPDCTGRLGTPDLVVMDWELPGLDHAACVAQLRAAGRQLKVVALSGQPDARAAALAAGADAFLYRGDPPDQLVETLRALGSS